MTSAEPTPTSAAPVPWARAGRSAELVRERLGVDELDVCVVLGSGLGAAAARLGERSMPMAEAGFPTPAVTGHAGRIHVGTVGGARVLVLAGRVHLYEGHHPHAVVHGVRAAARLGCRRVLLTNAAGAIRSDLGVGELVAVTDHLNLSGADPLAGAHDLPHDRFVDLSELYALTPTVAATGGLASGVYAALPGPTYETPAEVRMLRTLGADLVGMSTALEAIAAHALGVEVGAISLVTNAAAGLGDEVDHEEVRRIGAERADAVADAVAAVCAAAAPGSPPAPEPDLAASGRHGVGPAVVATPVAPAPIDLTRRALAARIDHTLLRPEASAAEVDRLCREAGELGVAAVCVSPSRLPQVAALARHHSWAPCTVVGFPSGAHRPTVKEAEARLAVAEGAVELDVVVNLGAVADGAWSTVTEELELVRRAIPTGTLKVILETAALGPGRIEVVARHALDAGADLLKTSTGFHPAGGATLDAVRTLVDIAAGRAEVKASGGIRDTDAALAMVAAGAHRLGTSSTVAILGGLD